MQLCVWYLPYSGACFQWINFCLCSSEVLHLISMEYVEKHFPGSYELYEHLEGFNRTLNEFISYEVHYVWHSWKRKRISMLKFWSRIYLKYVKRQCSFMYGYFLSYYHKVSKWFPSNWYKDVCYTNPYIYIVSSLNFQWCNFFFYTYVGKR